MRKILILLIALLVLGGGGGGAYYYFVIQPAQAMVTEGEETSEHGGAKDTAKHSKEAKKEGGHGSSVSEYVELDPLILPIIDNDGVGQVVSIVVAIEVDGASSKDKVRSMSPKLKDAYIQDMYGMLNRHAALKGGVVQVAIIKKRLNKITQEILGEGVAGDVLLQVVEQRPI